MVTGSATYYLARWKQKMSVVQHRNLVLSETQLQTLRRTNVIHSHQHHQCNAVNHLSVYTIHMLPKLHQNQKPTMFNKTTDESASTDDQWLQN